jgi:ureidoglycolate hydrolase
MTVHESLLEIRQYEGLGYQPIIDYGAWRVAILRYHPELEPQAISSMQRHDETDEVFVLLAGRCILFLGDGDAEIGTLHAVDMQPLQAYNVKQRAWHTHTLSRDAVVLIVENRDTSSANSPTRPVLPDQSAWLAAEAARLWSGIAQA